MYLYILIAIVAFSYIVYLYVRKEESDNNIWDYSMTFRAFIAALVVLVYMILKIISFLLSLYNHILMAHLERKEIPY